MSELLESKARPAAFQVVIATALGSSAEPPFMTDFYGLGDDAEQDAVVEELVKLNNIVESENGTSRNAGRVPNTRNIRGVEVKETAGRGLTILYTRGPESELVLLGITNLNLGGERGMKLVRKLDDLATAFERGDALATHSNPVGFYVDSTGTEWQLSQLSWDVVSSVLVDVSVRPKASGTKNTSAKRRGRRSVAVEPTQVYSSAKIKHLRTNVRPPERFRWSDEIRFERSNVRQLMRKLDAFSTEVASFVGGRADYLAIASQLWSDDRNVTVEFGKKVGGHEPEEFDFAAIDTKRTELAELIADAATRIRAISLPAISLYNDMTASLPQDLCNLVCIEMFRMHVDYREPFHRPLEYLDEVVQAVSARDTQIEQKEHDSSGNVDSNVVRDALSKLANARQYTTASRNVGNMGNQIALATQSVATVDVDSDLVRVFEVTDYRTGKHSGYRYASQFDIGPKVGKVSSTLFKQSLVATRDAVANRHGIPVPERVKTWHVERATRLGRTELSEGSLFKDVTVYAVRVRADAIYDEPERVLSGIAYVDDSGWLAGLTMRDSSYVSIVNSCPQVKSTSTARIVNRNGSMKTTGFDLDRYYEGVLDAPSVKTRVGLGKAPLTAAELSKAFADCRVHRNKYLDRDARSLEPTFPCLTPFVLGGVES